MGERRSNVSSIAIANDRDGSPLPLQEAEPISVVSCKSRRRTEVVRCDDGTFCINVVFYRTYDGGRMPVLVNGPRLRSVRPATTLSRVRAAVRGSSGEQSTRNRCSLAELRRPRDQFLIALDRRVLGECGRGSAPAQRLGVCEQWRVCAQGGEALE